MTFSFEAFGRNDFEDEQEVRDRHWKISASDVVVDVGAGIGSYALPALATGAKVFAFSPDQIHTACLLKNAASNTGFRERLRIIPAGLYSKTGWLWLEDNARYTYSEHAKEDAEQFPVMALDDMQLPRVDWIKIDVEGNEVEVLKGAVATIRWCQPRILVENHLFMNATLEKQVIDFVESLGMGYRATTFPHESVSHSFFEVTG